MNIKATLFAGVVLCIAREAAGNIKATLFVGVVLCIARRAAVNMPYNQL